MSRKMHEWSTHWQLGCYICIYEVNGSSPRVLRFLLNKPSLTGLIQDMHAGHPSETFGSCCSRFLASG